MKYLVFLLFIIIGMMAREIDHLKKVNSACVNVVRVINEGGE